MEVVRVLGSPQTEECKFKDSRDPGILMGEEKWAQCLGRGGNGWESHAGGRTGTRQGLPEADERPILPGEGWSRGRSGTVCVWERDALPEPCFW